MADAPELQAEWVCSHSWRVWCAHCRRWHRHGPLDGHRVAHCARGDSPYRRTGYVLLAPVEPRPAIDTCGVSA